MPTANGPTTAPETAHGRSCHGTAGGGPSWLRQRRGLIVGAAVAAGGTAFAIGGGWIAAASLLPFLPVLLCGAMMSLCMKGMNHGQQNGASQLSPDRVATARNSTVPSRPSPV